MRTSFRLALAGCLLLSVAAHAQRVLVGTNREFQSAWGVGISGADIVHSLCHFTFTPTTRAVTPTNPMAGRTAVVLPRIPCEYLPGIVPHPLTHGLVSSYLITFQELRTASIRDLGTYDVRCTNTVAAFDLYHGDFVDGFGSCGATWLPGELFTTPLLDSVFRFEVFNNPPTIGVTHGGTGLLAGREVRHDAAVVLDSHAADADGSVTVTWRITSPRGVVSTATGLTTSLRFNGEVDFGGWIIEVVADDRQGERVTQSYDLQVLNQAPRPVISGPARVRVRSDLTLAVSPDEDGGPYTAVQWEALAPGATSWAPVGTPGSVTLTLPTTRASLGAWRFRVRVTDNETPALSGTSAEFAVEVYNELPTVTASGPARIQVGEPFALTSTATDPDGGPVTVRWIVIQAPNASSVALGTPLAAPPGSTHPGTWVFRAQGEDDEGETAPSAPVAVVVNAPPVAAIVDAPATLRGPGAFDLTDASQDPDSHCANASDPHRCHRVAPGETFTPLSGGLVRWTWYVDSLPAGYSLFHPTGRVSEAFPGVSGSSSVLHFEPGQIPFGDYRFRVVVEDAEGGPPGEASITVRVEPPEVPPIAHIAMPQRYLVGPGNVLLSTIFLDGTLSFDLDNAISDLLMPGAGVGIRGYAWSAVGPTGCTLSPTPDALPMSELFAAGQVLPAECLGVWRIGLTVLDDDEPQLSDSREQDIVIGRCAGDVCIDRPTMERPQLVDTSEPVNVPIYYYVDPPVFTRYPYGFYGVIDIIPAGGTTPVFTLYDTTISTRPAGTLASVVWHGERSGGGSAPSGTYDVRARVMDVSLVYGPEVDRKNLAILFEDVRVEVADTSTRYSSHEDLEAGVNRPGFDWTITGALSVDRVRMVVRAVGLGAGVAFDETIDTTRSSGRFEWTGQTTTGTLLPPGDYDVEISAFRGSRPLATSAPRRLTVYRLRLGPAAPGPLTLAVNGDDDNGNGVTDSAELAVTGEDDLVPLAVTVEPPTLDGTLQVMAADGGTGVALFVGPTKPLAAPPSVSVPGIAVPDYHVEGRSPGRSAVALVFTPPTGPALPEVRREVSVVGVEVLTATGVPAPSLVAGLWENGHTQLAPGSPAGGGPFSVNNAATSNFVDVDPARFVVRVTDAVANRDPAAEESITAEIGTLVAWPLDALGERWADAPTPVALRETGPDTGVFVSEAQLLTNNDEASVGLDDELAAFSPRAGAGVADEAPNDRTHRLSALGSSTPAAGFIGGGVRVSYAGAGTLRTTLPVCGRAPEERRSISLRVSTLLEPFTDVNGNGTFEYTESNGTPGHQADEVSEPWLDLSTGKTTMLAGGPMAVAAGCDGRGQAVTDEYVDFRIRRSNMAWAPACIEFRRTGPLTVLDDDRLIGSAGLLRDGVITMATERVAFFNVIDTSTLGPVLQDTIDVVFGFSRCTGCFAYTDSPTWATWSGGRVLIFHASGELDDSLRNLAHELGHAITNTDDLPNPNWQFFPAAFTDTDEDYKQRRFDSDAGIGARTTRLPADLTGLGNTLLHSY